MSAGAASAHTLRFEPVEPPSTADEITLASPRSTDLPRESWQRVRGHLGARNVGQATLRSYYPPSHLATGEAVIVAPGGGFLGLAIENEGWVVAEALAARGITAFVLKYRTLPTPEDPEAFRAGILDAMAGKAGPLRMPDDTPERALVDARFALREVRDNAASYGIDRDRVGMLGFSAGGYLALTAALDLPPGERPDFIAPIYPKMEARAVPADAPPMFVAIAADDSFLGDGSLGLIRSWCEAKRPVEFHLYQAGGHGYGLGRRGTTSAGWFPAFLAWMQYRRSEQTQRKD